MEAIAVLLFLMLFVLYAGLNAIAQAISSHRSAETTDLSGIEEQLKNIFLTMGGEEKLRKDKELKRKELKKRLRLSLQKIQDKSELDAQKEANRLFEDAEFEEATSDYPYKFDSIEKWVKNAEIEERNQNKYGQLLDQARDYLKDKTIIQPNEMKLQEAASTDYAGEHWLIEKMIQGKRLKKVEEYKDDYYQLKHYEVLDPKL